VCDTASLNHLELGISYLRIYCVSKIFLTRVCSSFPPSCRLYRMKAADVRDCLQKPFSGWTC
jgi:hypothetical protein